MRLPVKMGAREHTTNMVDHACLISIDIWFEDTHLCRNTASLILSGRRWKIENKARRKEGKKEISISIAWGWDRGVICIGGNVCVCVCVQFAFLVEKNKGRENRTNIKPERYQHGQSNIRWWNHLRNIVRLWKAWRIVSCVNETCFRECV